MYIGVPKEIKNNEYRVGLTPDGVRELSRSGHQIAARLTQVQQSAFPIGITSQLARALLRRRKTFSLSRG